MNIQQWKCVKGYEGIYIISNEGQIKKIKTNRILHPSEDKNGYFIVTLQNTNKRKMHFVHRLIAIAFIPNLLGKPNINHINGDKKDNSINNLEWCTQHENVLHSFRMNLCKRKKGFENPLSIPIVQISISGEYIKTWANATAVQSELGFSHGHIRNCVNGKRKTAYGFLWQKKSANI